MKKPLEPKPKPDPQILFLTIKKRWFDEIKAGIKKVEYREVKPYWTRRIEGRKYNLITFQNGYAADAPRITLEYMGYYIEEGYYCIMLGELISTKPDDIKKFEEVE